MGNSHKGDTGNYILKFKENLDIFLFKKTMKLADRLLANPTQIENYWLDFNPTPWNHLEFRKLCRNSLNLGVKLLKCCIFFVGIKCCDLHLTFEAIGGGSFGPPPYIIHSHCLIIIDRRPKSVVKSSQHLNRDFMLFYKPRKLCV